MSARKFRARPECTNFELLIQCGHRGHGAGLKMVGYRHRGASSASIFFSFSWVLNSFTWQIVSRMIWRCRNWWRSGLKHFICRCQNSEYFRHNEGHKMKAIRQNWNNWHFRQVRFQQSDQKLWRMSKWSTIDFTILNCPLHRCTSKRVKAVAPDFWYAVIFGLPKEVWQVKKKKTPHMSTYSHRWTTIRYCLKKCSCGSLMSCRDQLFCTQRRHMLGSGSQISIVPKWAVIF